MHTGRRLRGFAARSSLLVRYGVVSGLLVVFLGLVLGNVLATTVQNRALAQSEQTAASIARLAVGPMLERDDFDQGVIAPKRIERLTRAMDTVVTSDRVARVKIFDRAGTVLFADDPALIGERFPADPDLQAALDGRRASDLDEPGSGENESEVDLGRILEVYVPIRKTVTAGADREVVGAFKIYLPYEPVARSTAADVRRLLLWLGGGLLVLWAGLFQLVASASHRLRDYASEQAQRARHDELTGLPNRVLLADRANQALLVARRSGTSTALLIVDLDRLKEVNDTLGHHFGDLLLSAVGTRLRGELREADTVARIGGDEFAVLLPEVLGVDAALEVADHLAAAMRTPFDIDGVTLEMGATLGVASYPEHGRDVVRLLQCADVAMYAAKQDRRAVRVYDRGMDAFTPDRLALFGELRRAIEHDQLSVHYQPQVDMTTGRVTGVEGLVRWQHPEHGLLAPDEFVPLAEHTGLIRPLTWSVLKLAASECRRWRAAGLDLTVAVNVSVRSLLDEDLVCELGSLLTNVGLPPAALELEITETTVMADPERSLAMLAELRRLGVGLSIDDYGTGQASLAYLNRLPVDTLKIDRSFVVAMLGSDNDAAIVRSTIELAASIGLAVVAEGVETEQTWRWLAELGCDAAQGNWLAPPVPADSVPDIVRRLERRLGGAPART
ncbi:hypothetical protein BH20ACT6_BH20ACT6_19270 [soil metagenome]